MKSSESSTREATQIIEQLILPNVLKDDLKKNIVDLKKLFINNVDFFNNLLTKCLEAGKSLYYQDIENIIWENISELEDDDIFKALTITYKICSHLCRTSDLTKNFGELGRIEIEEEITLIHSSFYNTNEMNILGEENLDV